MPPRIFSIIRDVYLFAYAVTFPSIIRRREEAKISTSLVNAKMSPRTVNMPGTKSKQPENGCGGEEETVKEIEKER